MLGHSIVSQHFMEPEGSVMHEIDKYKNCKPKFEGASGKTIQK
jgi:hypothetical protein